MNTKPLVPSPASPSVARPASPFVVRTGIKAGPNRRGFDNRVLPVGEEG